jgi:hypothetical protein
MTDITNSHLEAAIIDQKVAGAFAGKRYAFAAVIQKDGWQLGVAVENEPGYSPVDGKTFTLQAEAKQWAEGLNKHIGLSDEDALSIIITTMRGPRARAVR